LSSLIVSPPGAAGAGSKVRPSQRGIDEPCPSLGPALVFSDWASLWVYLAGPIAGAPSQSELPTCCVVLAVARRALTPRRERSALSGGPEPLVLQTRHLTHRGRRTEATGRDGPQGAFESLSALAGGDHAGARPTGLFKRPVADQDRWSRWEPGFAPYVSSFRLIKENERIVLQPPCKGLFSGEHPVTPDM